MFCYAVPLIAIWVLLVVVPWFVVWHFFAWKKAMEEEEAR
jgi:hypothetical protein